MENEIISNKELGEELDKPINKKNWEKKSTLTPFVDNVWGADLADMKLIGKFNKGFRFLLCVIDTFSKYALVIPFKHKNQITTTNGFQKHLRWI